MRIAGVGAVVLMVIAGCGDGRNKCELAEERVRACLNSTEDERPPPDIPVCEGRKLCFADCLDGSSCEAIKDRFSGLPTDLSRFFSVCEGICRERYP
jgi:hypothetical protein